MDDNPEKLATRRRQANQKDNTIWDTTIRKQT